MLFENAFEGFKIYATKRHKKQGFDTLERNFNNHVLSYFKGKDIYSLNINDFLAWQDYILDFNFSNNFNSLLYSCFNNFLNYCCMYHNLKCNYLKTIGNFPKKIEIKSYTVYTLFQFRKFRFFLKDFVIKHFFNFMYFYGTRPSECMALRFKDRKGLYVRILHSIHRRGNRELDTPKNVSSIRIIKISYLMLFRIWLLKVYYTIKYKTFSSDYYIFGGKKPLSSSTIDRRKKDAYTKAHLPSITQHEFRHSYATRMVHKKKVPIDVVSRSMGHSKVSTTCDIYIHNEKNLLNKFLIENNI